MKIQRISLRQSPIKGVAMMLSLMIILSVVFFVGLFFGEENIPEAPVVIEDPELPNGDTPLIEEPLKIQIEALKESVNGVALDSQFLITINRQNMTAEEIKSQVYMDVDWAYEIKEATNGFMLRFLELIPEDEAWMITYQNDAYLSYSWEFQSVKPTHIIGSYPMPFETQVALDTAITIYFNQTVTESVEPFIQIIPFVSGAWTYEGPTATFVPEAALQPGMLYTVQVRADYALYYELYRQIAFITQDYLMEGGVLFFDSHLQTLVPSPLEETMALRVSVLDETVLEEKVTATVYELENEQSVLALYQGYQTMHENPDRLKAYVTDTARVFEGVFVSEVGDAVIQLEGMLPYGHYVVRLDVVDQVYYQLLQVSPYTGVALGDGKKLLVWVMDPYGRGAADAMYVTIQNRLFGVTDTDGLVQVDVSNVHPSRYHLVVLNDEDNQKFYLPVHLDESYFQKYVTKHQGNLHSDRSHYELNEDMYLYGFIPPNWAQEGEAISIVFEQDGFLLQQNQMDVDAFGIFEQRFSTQGFKEGPLNVLLLHQGQVLERLQVNLLEMVLEETLTEMVTKPCDANEDSENAQLEEENDLAKGVRVRLPETVYATGDIMEVSLYEDELPLVPIQNAQITYVLYDAGAMWVHPAPSLEPYDLTYTGQFLDAVSIGAIYFDGTTMRVIDPTPVGHKTTKAPIIMDFSTDLRSDGHNITVSATLRIYDQEQPLVTGYVLYVQADGPSKNTVAYTYGRTNVFGNSQLVFEVPMEAACYTIYVMALTESGHVVYEQFRLTLPELSHTFGFKP